MRLYKFVARGKGALSDDSAGTNLPAQPSGNPWTYAGTTDVYPGGGARIGADSDAILEGIQDHGYYIWPSGT